MSKEYQEFLKNNKVLKHSVNGISRFLILWFIKYNESLHGYAIIQELDKFFSNLISEGTLKKHNASKIYPILKDMEESGLIVGEWKQLQNQKVKFYSITDKGKFIVQYFFDNLINLETNPHMKIVYEDLSQNKD
ncbi:PadR family transcriptional regulator [Methanobrevibacter sp.]|uniref:PadR family transcriptional regulator n=1 Tax=Methanobrevibacter sp. TaxID=66852 RepID=UPI00389061AA